jgi:hypothetical protein
MTSVLLRLLMTCKRCCGVDSVKKLLQTQLWNSDTTPELLKERAIIFKLHYTVVCRRNVQPLLCHLGPISTRNLNIAHVFLHSLYFCFSIFHNYLLSSPVPRKTLLTVLALLCNVFASSFQFKYTCIYIWN